MFCVLMGERGRRKGLWGKRFEENKDALAEKVLWGKYQEISNMCVCVIGDFFVRHKTYK